MFKDEFEIAQIRVGVTPAGELDQIVQARQGHVVGDTHYYTTRRRKATLGATCQDGIVRKVRLGLGLWGPLAELARVPPGVVSECSLERMGTSAMACLGAGDLFHGRQRVLQVYGPPTRSTESTLEYDWLFAPIPRRMRFQVDGPAVIDMVLELVDEAPTQRVRPLAPATSFERTPRLPAGLLEKFRAGEEHLRQGRHAEAERLFGEILTALNEADLDPSDLKREVAARQSLAQVAGGRGDAVERLGCLLEDLEKYASYNPPEVLRTRLALGQAHRLAGNEPAARQELENLWDLLQASQYYQEPEVQHLVRRTAEELELVGVSWQAEEIRRLDALGSP